MFPLILALRKQSAQTKSNLKKLGMTFSSPIDMLTGPIFKRLNSNRYIELADYVISFKWNHPIKWRTNDNGKNKTLATCVLCILYTEMMQFCAYYCLLHQGMFIATGCVHLQKQKHKG